MLRAAVLAVLSLWLVALPACSTSKKEVHAAQHSLYDSDFATVYAATLETIRQLYPNIDDNPGTGKIATAWHPVPYAASSDDAAGAQGVPGTPSQGMAGGGIAPGAGSVPASGMGGGGMGRGVAYKKYYVRFDVNILGGRPWRVKVVGHAAVWDVGAAMPTELHGAARPSWLTPRVEALEIEIYKKMKLIAVAADDEEGSASAEEELAKTDPASFHNIPPEAAKVLAALKDVLVKRDSGALRASVADDVVWSLGGAPGVDTAMAMWQADPDSLEQMARLVGETCVADGGKRVRCPGGDPTPGQYQLVLEPRVGGWKVTSFVKAE